MIDIYFNLGRKIHSFMKPESKRKTWKQVLYFVLIYYQKIQYTIKKFNIIIKVNFMIS